MFGSHHKVEGWPGLTGPLLPPSPYYPKEKDVYRALELTPLHRVKAVFIGYDPYHSLATADGLAFSSRLRTTPKSLYQIKKELKRSLGITRRSNDLTGWALQDVLLLNMALTVKPEEPGSHIAHWSDFFREVLRLLRASPRRHVFVLCGKKTHAFNNEFFFDHKKDVVLEVGHPSPMNRGMNFVGSDIFIKLNQVLKEIGYEPPNWSI